jgi:hydrogenase maturation protease
MSVGSSADGNGVTPAPTGVTLVVGLGNPLLADDGIGWRVAEAVRARLAEDAAQTPLAGAPVRARPAGNPVLARPAGNPVLAADPQFADVEVDNLAVGGLTLMERLVGYRRAILVDAMVTGAYPPGTVRRFSIADIPGREATHLDSAHDASLAVALAAGRSLGADLPADIAIVAIEAVRVDEFVEELTPAVAAAIPAAVEAVLAAIGETGA